MAHGKSLLLAAIQRPEPKFIHEHTYSGIFSRPSNVPYVHPERDEKPGARLRLVTSPPAPAAQRPARTALSGSAKRRHRANLRSQRVHILSVANGSITCGTCATCRIHAADLGGAA